MNGIEDHLKKSTVVPQICDLCHIEENSFTFHDCKKFEDSCGSSTGQNNNLIEVKIEFEEPDTKSKYLPQVYNSCNISSHTPRNQEVKIEFEDHDIKSSLLPQVYDYCYVEGKPVGPSNTLMRPLSTQLKESIKQSSSDVNDFQDYNLNFNQAWNELKVVLFRENLEEKKYLVELERSRMDTCNNSDVKQKNRKGNVQVNPKKLNRKLVQCKYKCTQCKYETKFTADLRKHLVVHRNDTFFKCLQCDFQTKHKDCLRRHDLIHKEEVQTYTCDICDFKTKYRQNLKAHVLTHKDIKDVKHFSCDNCEYKTKYAHHMKTHVLIHKDIEEVEHFSCNNCEYKTKYAHHMKSHVIIHKNIEEIEYFFCNMCGFKTKRRDNLKRHLLTHKDIE